MREEERIRRDRVGGGCAVVLFLAMGIGWWWILSSGGQDRPAHDLDQDGMPPHKMILWSPESVDYRALRDVTGAECSRIADIYAARLSRKTRVFRGDRLICTGRPEK